jgi:hypothetical protein
MFISKKWLLCIAMSAAFPSVVLAEENQDGHFFAGVDVSGGMATGSSGTKNGGDSFGKGGTVNNLKFKETFGIGAHAGYQFTPALSAFLSYHHTSGDIHFDADFPNRYISTSIKGKAETDALLANVAYAWDLTDDTTIHASAGAGVAFNQLKGLVEHLKINGNFTSTLTDQTKAHPMAQLGIGVTHQLSKDLSASVAMSTAYVGNYETGNTRQYISKTRKITPYKINDVWRTQFTASVNYQF